MIHRLCNTAADVPQHVQVSFQKFLTIVIQRICKNKGNRLFTWVLFEHGVY